MKAERRYLWRIDRTTQFLAQRVGAFEVKNGQVELVDCQDGRLPGLLARLEAEPALELTYERTPAGGSPRQRVLTRVAVKPTEPGYADALGQAITLETGLTFGLDSEREPLF